MGTVVTTSVLEQGGRTDFHRATNWRVEGLAGLSKVPSFFGVAVGGTVGQCGVLVGLSESAGASHLWVAW